MRWAILELLEEAEAALASIASTPPASRVRAGKCVYMCSLSNGQKAGEVVVSGGEDGSGSDARRTMQPGDIVVVSRVETSNSSSSSGIGIGIGSSSSSSSSAPCIRVEAEVKVASPLVLEPVGDKARGALLLTSSSSSGPAKPLWRVDKLANAVQFERALTAVRIVASAAAAGASRQDTLARMTASAGQGRGGGGQRADAVRGLVKEASER
jgi:hypothetical protein